MTRATTRQLFAHSTTNRNVRNDLQVPHTYGIIAVYLKHGNGGYDVNVGISDSRGGSRETEGIRGYGLAAYQEAKTCGLQSQRCVAYHARRPASVPGFHQEYQTNTRKLDLFAFSAATQRTVADWNPSTERCRVSLLRVHSMTLPCGKSSEWYGVAWEGIPQ